ncbi:hypothetical protein AKJ44_00690 [candidate division MSBL1 archaeon SCGC-AAA261F17]|uniref:MobA-like NTP transferase domain-containing protein n=1 Tax=candidate division MSBL1 archaeon SCGC-AAA261F17 TaxID=1698274 RepID=A0A133V7B9_9EURY|nr:hypothetical protein AKJ44_00690 [candidate division MSBL1 archaeon SCGC-AAA261F17]
MIGTVILAAGESKRMGRPKLLLEVKGERVIDRVVNSFKDVADEVVVVLGHEPENLIPILGELEVRWEINEEYQEGMVSSIKTGVKTLKDCEALFLALGDQSIIKQDFLNAAIGAWKNGAKLVSPIHEDKKGHPVLFDQSLFEEILSLKREETLRKVIHEHDEDHELIDAGKWAIMDFDTPEDYQAVKEKF